MFILSLGISFQGFLFYKVNIIIVDPPYVSGGFFVKFVIMAKANKKSDKIASEIFHSIMKASVSNPQEKLDKILIEIENNLDDISQGLSQYVQPCFEYSNGRQIMYTLLGSWEDHLCSAVDKVISDARKKYPDVIAGKIRKIEGV